MTKREILWEAKHDYYHALEYHAQSKKSLRIAKRHMQRSRENKKTARCKLRELGFTKKQLKHYKGWW